MSPTGPGEALVEWAWVVANGSCRVPRCVVVGIREMTAGLVPGKYLRVGHAHHRLKNYVVNKPDCGEARRLLADPYRAGGFRDEAAAGGTWSKTVPQPRSPRYQGVPGARGVDARPPGAGHPVAAQLVVE